MKLHDHDRNLSRPMTDEEIRALPFFHKRLSAEELVGRLPCGCVRNPGELSLNEIYKLAHEGNEEAQKFLKDRESKPVVWCQFDRELRTFD